MLHSRYPRLWARDGFPRLVPAAYDAGAVPPLDLPCANSLRKLGLRLLVIAVDSGRALECTEEITRQGLPATVAIAGVEHAGQASLQSPGLTPDVFFLHRFLRLDDQPRFLHYLVQSRRPDAAVLAGAGAQLFAPHLRALLPQLPIIADQRGPLVDEIACCIAPDMGVVADATLRDTARAGPDSIGDETTFGPDTSWTEILEHAQVRCSSRRLPAPDRQSAGAAAAEAARGLHSMDDPQPARRQPAGRALTPLLLWGIAPDPRLEPALGALRRAMPERLKVWLKEQFVYNR